MFSIKREKEKTKWKSLEFYKDNWSFFVFMPAGVGGLFQLLHLLSMDPSLVRFFSVEQVVPDGLLFIILCLFGYLVFYCLKKAYMPREQLELDWNFKNIVTSVKRPLVISLFLFLFLFIFPWLNKEAIKNPPLIFEIFQTSVLAIAIALFLEFLFIIRILHYFKQFKNPQLEFDKFDEHYEKIFKFYSPLGMLFYLFISLSLLVLGINKLLSIYEKTSSFNNLANEVVLIDAVKSKMKIKEDVVLKYYNGKYIFLEKKMNRLLALVKI